MSNIQLFTPDSPASPTSISIRQDVTLGTGDNEQSPQGSQMWIVTGCASNPTGGGVKATVTLVMAGQVSVTGELQVFSNVAGQHMAWPQLGLISSFPMNGQMQVEIASSGSAAWGPNDWIQIAVVELDHTGIGGGM